MNQSDLLSRFGALQRGAIPVRKVGPGQAGLRW